MATLKYFLLIRGIKLNKVKIKLHFSDRIILYKRILSKVKIGFLTH